MIYDFIIQEEVNFNYVKLFYELKDLREVIDVLQIILLIFRYYVEVQFLMSEIFLNYCDYQ